MGANGSEIFNIKTYAKLKNLKKLLARGGALKGPPFSNINVFLQSSLHV